MGPTFGDLLASLDWAQTLTLLYSKCLECAIEVAHGVLMQARCLFSQCGRRELTPGSNCILGCLCTCTLCTHINKNTKIKGKALPKSGWRHIPVIPVLKGLRDKVVRPCLRKGGRDGEMEEGRKEGRGFLTV